MMRKERTEAADTEKVLTENFDDFDANRIAGLTDLAVFQESKNTADRRNLARLERKYGEAHPLVRDVRSKIESNKVFAAEIEREITRTKTRVPDGNASAWTIHGYVFDAEGRPVAGAAVLIFDEAGELASRAGRTATDKKGYFRLAVKDLKNTPEKVRVGVSREFVAAEVFAPAPGEVDYVEMFAAGEIEETPCDQDEKPNEKPTKETIPFGQNFSDWLVIGKITNADERGVAKLKVRVFDRDLMLDDALGETETDNDGVYGLRFTKEQFGDFGENYPELYLIVEDAAGNRLFDGRREMKTRAGRIELIDIKLTEDGQNKENTKDKQNKEDANKTNDLNR